MLTGPQVRERRDAIGLTRQELASAASISISTLQAFEVSGSDPRGSTLEAIERALIKAEHAAREAARDSQRARRA